MKRTSSGTRGIASVARHTLAVLALAALAACGGGGGGDGGIDLIDVTAGNRDSVAHAAGASFLALGVSSSIPVLGGPGGVASQRELPQAVAWRSAVGAARERPQALITGAPQACLVSGSVTVTIDDRNGNGSWDLGEPATVVFNQCQDNAYDVLDGTAVLTIVGGSASSFSATMGMTQLSQRAVNGRHGMTLDGNLDLGCTQLSTTSMRCTSTASSSIRAVVHTHMFDDTVTLRQGFVEDATYDDTTQHTMSTLRGTIDSSAAGGALSISTDQTIALLDADPYPHEGVLRVSGRQGALLVAPQSATRVRVDLDSNDDGMSEASTVEDWDWLL